MVNKTDYKKRGQRSPNYPAFNLEEAIKRANILWGKDGKAGAPKDITLRHLGYGSPKSGPALRMIATLKSFGLTEEKGGRIILTNQALDLVIYSHNDQRYIDTLKSIALKPSIYNDLYLSYDGEFPSNDTIKAELIRDYNFNKDAVDKFIEDFFETISFAGLTKQDLKKGFDEEKQEIKGITQLFPKSEKKDKMIDSARAFNIMLSKENEARLLIGKFPIDKEDVEILKGWIDLIAKPFLKAEETEEKENDDPLKDL